MTTPAAPPALDPLAVLRGLAALRRLAGSYPAGHPMIGQKLKELEEVIAALLQAHNPICIDVIRGDVFLDGIVSSSDNQANQQLLAQLSALGIDSIHIQEGVQRDELLALLQNDPATFERVYERMDSGREGAVTLMHHNGMVLARTPAPEGAIGRVYGDRPKWGELIMRTQSGIVRSTSPADGVDRIYAYRTLADFPLVVLVGLDVARARQEFWSASAYSLFSVGALSLMIILATTLLSLAMRRQRLLLEQVRSEEQRFRDFAEVSTDWLYEMNDRFRFSVIGIG